MQNDKHGESRRSFVKGLVAGSAVLAGFLATGAKAQAKQASEDRSVPQDILYRETEEFRKYYDMLRS